MGYEVSLKPMSGSRTIYINRAPVLTLWAAVVAERLGFRRDEALTVAAVDTRIARINVRPGRVAYDDAAECRLEVLGEPERQLSRRRVHGAADRRARMIEEGVRARCRGHEQRQRRDKDTPHDYSPPALGCTCRAEQPSQQFSFFGSLKLIRQAYGRHVADLREADKTGAGQ